MNEAESKRLLSDDYGREGISRRAFLGTAGGAAFRVFVLDAADETMTVRFVRDYVSGKKVA